jgi:hypothetical protein
MKKKTRVIFAVITLCICVALILFKIIIYDEFTPLPLRNYFPQLPITNDKFKIRSLTTSEYKSVSQFIASQSCEAGDIAALQKILNVPIYQVSDTDKAITCQSYKVDSANTVLEFSAQSSFFKIMAYKQDDKYFRLLENMMTYPAWSFGDVKVSTQGKIYFSYGGWRYNRQDSSELFVIEKKY